VTTDFNLPRLPG